MARYVFEDPYLVEIENEANPENDKTLGIVAENNVMVVTNAKVENDKIRIILAWEALPQSKYTTIYNKHKAKKQLLENKFSKKTESKKQLYAVIRQADGNGFVLVDLTGYVVHTQIQARNENFQFRVKAKHLFFK